jgi:drug/metabolite transporter (DMT)-like permease
MAVSERSRRPVAANVLGPLTSSHPRIAIAVGAVAVSATAIFVDLAGCQPGTASFYRCVLALPFLLPLALREGRGIQRLGRRELLAAVVAGVLFAGDMLLWTQAIFDVGAGISTVIVNVQVIVVPLLALAIDREPITRLFLATLPVMALGVLLAGGVLDHGVRGMHTVRGTVEAVLAALCYSGFLFILRRSGRSTRALPSYTVVIVASAAGSWVGGALWHGFSFAPRLAAIGWLALAAICGQVVGWLLVASAAPKLSSESASVLLLLTPIGSLVLGGLVIGQRPTSLQLAGSLLILGCAAIIANMRRRGESF